MLDIRDFHVEATLNTTYKHKYINTYKLIEKSLINDFRMYEQFSLKFTLETQEVFPNFFPCVYFEVVLK